MNKCMRFRSFTGIIAMILICSMLPINSMKRSLESPREETLIQFSITQLPTEILQKVFCFLEYKLGFLTVCQAWRNIGSFNNWRSFMGPDLHLSKDNRVRIYRLLLANTNNGDAQTLDAMLANDPDRQVHMTEITTLVYMPLSKLASDPNILKVLKKYQVNIDNLHAASVLSSSAAYPPAQTEYIAELCDTLLCKDPKRLDGLLLKNETAPLFADNKTDYCVDFFIKTDLIPRYCTIDTVKKIIPLLTQIKSTIGGRNGRLRLIDTCLVGALKMQRLDIAEELLRNGVDNSNVDVDVDEIVHHAVINQNVAILTLLSKYGFKIQDCEPFDLYYHDDETIHFPSENVNGINTADANGRHCYQEPAHEIYINDKPYTLFSVSPLIYSICVQKSALVIKTLIEMGADPFEVDEEVFGDVLNLATRLGNQEIIQILQEARSNI